MSTPDAWLSWSGGKDSALALRVARAAGEVNIVGLLTTVNASNDRISMHGVRGELLRAQADRLGLPVHAVELPFPCPNGVYEARMAAAVGTARERGVTRMVFGDLYLADVRAYREEALAGTGVRAEFPLWGRPVDRAAHEIVDTGIRAVLACVDTAQLDREFVGRDYDADLLAALPDGVDPCGERGEFHTFVWDAPEFAAPIPVELGDRVDRDNLVFVDLLPARIT